MTIGMRSARPLRRAALLGLLALTIAPGGLIGCDRSKPKGPTETAAAAGVETYVVRGRFQSFRATPGGGVMMVHHEEIPAFKNKAGKVIGMKEMVMDFPLAEGVSVEGVAAGTPIEIEFVVDWSKAPFHRATRVSALPPDTALNLSQVKDASGG